MLRTVQLRLVVQYYGQRRVMISDSMKSLRSLLQKNTDLSDGVERPLRNSSTDAGSSFQATWNAGKKRTEDDRFQSLIENAKNRTTREKLGLSYIYGAALIRDAIGKGVLLPEIYFHNIRDVQALPHQSLIDTGVEFVPVSKETFNKHLNAELCTDGLFAVFAIPFRQRLSKKRSAEPLPVTVICDNIRDPGNMGKIIQSSVAISCDRILVTKGCVDVWDPKVLQVGRGAHFDALIETNLDWKEIGEMLPTDCSVYLADSSCVDGSDEKKERQSEEANARLWEYDAIDYCTGSHSVVVIGGETTGVSRQAFDFSRTKKERQLAGRRIHVPMMSGVDSLNSAVAGSIILFEISRQLKLRSHQ